MPDTHGPRTLDCLARRAGCVIAALLLVLARPASAQRLHVRASEEVTARPLAGVLAEVLDAANAVAVRGVLDTSGARTFALPRAGSYRVRIRRVGYEQFVSPAVSVAAGVTVDVLLVVPGRRVVLAGVEVREGVRCSRSAFSEPHLASLWEEMTKALTSSLLAREDAGSTEMRAFRRELRPNGSLVRLDVGLPSLTGARRPYVAHDAAALSRDGYLVEVDSTLEYRAPDEQVLVSEQFINEHCFTVARGRGATSGLFGIQFTPVAGRGNDIAGTIWIDSASAELRHVDYWYMHYLMPPAATGEDKSGGQVVFERRAGNRWLVSAWRLRMPRYGAARELRRRPVDAYEELGGIASPDSDADAPVAPALAQYRALLRTASVTGSVYDSLTGRPLAGARVQLSPIVPAWAAAFGLQPVGELTVIPLTLTTDEKGAFRLEDRPPGTYALGVQHPDVDSLDVPGLMRSMRLLPGDAVTSHFQFPSFATLSRGCAAPASRRSSDGGLVTGVVRSASDERVLVGAMVRVSWTALRRISATQVVPEQASVETRTDSTGTYRVCGAPDSAKVLVQAAGPNSRTGDVEAMVGRIGLASVNLRLAEVDVGESAPATGVISGEVTDSLGLPMSNAVITVDGTALEARTSTDGHYVLTGVPSGTQTARVRAIGREQARHTIAVRPASSNTVSFSLSRSQLLDRMVTTAPRGVVRTDVLEAQRRHRVAGGYLFLESDLKQRANMGQVLTGLSGLTVQMGKFNVDNTLGIYMRAASYGECRARIFVDRQETDYAVAASIPLEQLTAVEVYPRASGLPSWVFSASQTVGQMALAQKVRPPGGERNPSMIEANALMDATEKMDSQARQCGAVLLWTKR